MSSIFDVHLGAFKTEIQNALKTCYTSQKSLLVANLDDAGVDTTYLEDKSVFTIVRSFLDYCDHYELNKLYEIFTKLSKFSPGSPELKKAKEILEKAMNEQCKVFITSPPSTSVNKQINDFIEWKNTSVFYESPLQKEEKKDDSSSVISDNSNHIIDPKIYEKLENHLANEQWKEADLETMRLMIKIADSIESPNKLMKNREIITWLDNEDIKKIPDKALKTIDQLWGEYSDGHFGFTVQAKIWQKFAGKTGRFVFETYEEKFAKDIGWYDGKNWIKSHDEFNFYLQAPPGHLPSLSFPNNDNKEIDYIIWQKTFEHLIPRLLICLLTP